MNQAIGLGNAGDILYFMRVTLFIALLCMGYSVSQPNPTAKKKPDLLLAVTAESGSPDQKWSGLPPWQKKASEKAIERYAEAQEKKWRNWNDAMFERSS